MVNVNPDPIIHCMDRQCKGNTTNQGPKRHVSSKYPCPNGRVPHRFYLQWCLASKVPREVLRIDYELWRSGEPRFKDSAEAAWDKQLKELLDRGLMHNKTPGVKSNVSVTITGDNG